MGQLTGRTALVAGAGRNNGKAIKNLKEVPKALEEFTKSGGAAVWDFHVSDQVVSPTIRRSHPGKYARK